MRGKSALGAGPASFNTRLSRGDWVQQQGKGVLKWPKWRPVIAVSAAILLICIASIGWFYTFLQDKLFAERQAFFTQFAEKTAESIDLAIDDFWYRNEMCQKLITYSAPTSEAELFSALEYCSKTVNSEQATVLAFTEQGEFYSSDGHAGWFSEEAISFAADAGTRQTAIINLPYENTESTYFLLFTDMGEALEIANAGSVGAGSVGAGSAISESDSSAKTITHLALAVDVDSLQSAFVAQGFGDSCHVYLVTDTGRKLYQSSDSHRFIEGYNILSTIESSAEVIGGGTMNDLLTSFERDDTTAFEISYQGVDWFVSFQTISSGDHHLIVFAPTDLIGNNAAVLSQASLWFLLFICLLLALLFGIVILSIRTMVVQLRKANTLLEQQAQSADQANRAKSEFLSYMSHDIRTPINGIMGMTSIAMRNESDHDKVMDCLGKIDEASGHLLSLVNDVLDLSRIEQGKTAIVREPVYLPGLLEECASIIEGQLSTRNLSFVRDFGEMPHPHVLTDELHLRQILINILGNAVKFTPDGGRITFRVRQTEAHASMAAKAGSTPTAKAAEILLEVEDTGIGMEESYLLNIWEPFSQSRQGHCSTYEGTGLGMAITKRFVDMMDGDISVKSQLGRGSTFTVRLTVGIDEQGGQKVRAHAAESSLEGIKVLLVEDKELNREIAREILLGAGALVSCAENGKEALDAFAESPAGTFDIILMDVMMPVMDGLEATERIRSSNHPEASSIPIVALTAHAFEEDVRKSLEAGMNAHLSKPIDERILVQVLAQHRPQVPEKAEAGSAFEAPSAPLAGLADPGLLAKLANPADTASLAGVSILLAEDDPINMEVTQVILEDVGAMVTPAKNGELALKTFESSPAGTFDIVLMDLHMPLMDGLEATRRIRSLDRSDARTTPVFALTADFSPEERQAMESSGMDGVLTKPLSAKQLAKKMAQIADMAAHRNVER